MSDNYYMILGIEPQATLQEVKAAYRNLVKALHPDYYGENSEPFRKIQEAYDVLSDNDRRVRYDDELKAAEQDSVLRPEREPGQPSSHRVEEIDPASRPRVVEVFRRNPSEHNPPPFEEVFKSPLPPFFK